MKYRIVEYTTNGLDNFYTIEFQFSWLWIKIWRPITTDNKKPKTFNTLSEAQQYIKATTCQTRVVEEGEV